LSAKARARLRVEVRNPFYGYSAHLVARWCQVKYSTACAYKGGRCKSSALALELFKLHRDARILPVGWRMAADAITDPEGNETNMHQLRCFQAMMQWAHTLAQESGNPEHLQKYWEILKAA
jgi:hypothetical protein